MNTEVVSSSNKEEREKENIAVSSPDTNVPRTFYRRKLPPALISFSSEDGRQIFQSAIANGGTHAFFSLIEQLQTQPEPAYCGMTTLVIILNALAVDPRRSWKGPWRWYEESMLNCCVDLEKVKQTGITFSTFACLARCQGLDVQAVHASNSTVDEFRRIVKQTCTASSPSQPQPTSFLAVSYTRKVVGQTGSGHFSPIGAYDEASDHVLLLDTARFKYGPHWIPLELMFDAMLPLDPDTAKSRGYVILSYDGLAHAKNVGDDSLSHLPLSVLFGSKKSRDFLRREYKQYIEGIVMEKGKESIVLESVVSYWTNNFSNTTLVWELVTPQLQPVDAREIQLVKSLRHLIKSLIQGGKGHQFPESLFKTTTDAGPGGECCTTSTCNSSGRLIEISPIEAMYIVYLGSISLETRKEIVYAGGDAEDDTVREQLLAETALISYALEACDDDV